jgi:hypothetical protein
MSLNLEYKQAVLQNKNRCIRNLLNDQTIVSANSYQVVFLAGVPHQLHPAIQQGR